ncbi:unnamed protein product [Effrenium voratum]|nr:unnamed protein product [Effrenium voratum]
MNCTHEDKTDGCRATDSTLARQSQRRVLLGVVAQVTLPQVPTIYQPLGTQSPNDWLRESASQQCTVQESRRASALEDTLCGKLLRSSGSCVQKASCVFIRLQCTVGRGADYVKLNAPAPVQKVFILCALKQTHNALFLKQGRICISCPSELHSLTHSLHFSANEQRWIEWSRPCRGKAPCRQNQAQDP